MGKTRNSRIKRIKQWLRVRQAYLLSRLPVSAPEKKFVIFGQGRTGSTLLVDLLNAAGDIRCDREIFNIYHFTGEQIASPLQYIRGRSKRFNGTAYGFKVKVYQLRYDHGVASPRKLLQDLLSDGYSIIYLSRDNVLQHAFSNIKRSLTGVTHVRGKKNEFGKIAIPVGELIAEINDRLRFKEDEMQVLKGLPFLHIVYEDDLLTPHAHLVTVNKVRAYLHLPPVSSVKTIYQKISATSLVNEIENFEDVRTALRSARLEHLLAGNEG